MERSIAACDSPAKSKPRSDSREVAVTDRSDAGEMTLGRMIGLGSMVFIACLLFLFFDAKHRIAGYETAHGHGLQGTVTVANCKSQLLGGSVCSGDFVSADGKIQRHDVRINGAKTAGTQIAPAAISGADADEAWTTEGSPWSAPSTVQLGALAAIVLVIWLAIRGGPGAWMNRYAQDRAHAHEREVRLGRVH
jgi:hypothetical protein